MTRIWSGTSAIAIVAAIAATAAAHVSPVKAGGQGRCGKLLDGIDAAGRQE